MSSCVDLAFRKWRLSGVRPFIVVTELCWESGRPPVCSRYNSNRVSRKQHLVFQKYCCGFFLIPPKMLCVCMCLYMYVLNVCMCMYMCIYVYMVIYVCIYICMYTNTHTHICIYSIYIHTYIPPPAPPQRCYLCTTIQASRSNRQQSRPDMCRPALFIAQACDTLLTAPKTKVMCPWRPSALFTFRHITVIRRRLRLPSTPEQQGSSEKASGLGQSVPPT